MSTHPREVDFKLVSIFRIFKSSSQKRLFCFKHYLTALSVFSGSLQSHCNSLTLSDTFSLNPLPQVLPAPLVYAYLLQLLVPPSSPHLKPSPQTLLKEPSLEVDWSLFGRRGVKLRAGSPCPWLSGLAGKKAKTTSVRNQSQGHRVGGPEDPPPRGGP